MDQLSESVQFKLDNSNKFEQDCQEILKMVLNEAQNNKICNYSLKKECIREWSEQNTENEFILNKNKQFDFTSNRSGIQILDKEIISKQRGILGHVLKKIGTNILSGKSIMSVSFPIEIFEGQSMLERIAKSFSYLPHFIKCQQKDELSVQELSVQQIKQILSFVNTQHSMNMEHKKPFNPILGETVQMIMGNTGVTVQVEQVTHHPPVSYFYVSTQDNSFNYYGKCEIHANQGMNSLKGSNNVLQKFRFNKTNTEYIYQPPQYKINGLMLGTRDFNIVEQSWIIDMSTMIVTCIQFNPDDNKHRPQQYKGLPTYIKGTIFKATTKLIQKIITSINKKKYIDVQFKGKSDEYEQILSQFYGNWVDHFYIDDQEVWNFNNLHPFKMQNRNNRLPSDSSFRLDSIHFRLDDLKEAQKAKDLLEDIQRQDRKLRKDK